MDRQTDRWMDKQTDGQTDGWTDGWKISPFYRTLSPVEAAALIQPNYNRKAV